MNSDSEPGLNSCLNDRRSPSGQWQFYDLQTNVAKARALERLQIVEQIDVLLAAGMTKSQAVSQIADLAGRSASSIWSWLRVALGVGHQDRLAYLVPVFKAGGRPAHIEDEDLRAVASDYMRPERLSWASCVRRLHAAKAADGKDLPHGKTLWRRLNSRFGAATIAALRR